MSESGRKAHVRKAAEQTIPRLSRKISALMAAFSKNAQITADMQAHVHMTEIHSKYDRLRSIDLCLIVVDASTGFSPQISGGHHLLEERTRPIF